jgi:hypothetical protein
METIEGPLWEGVLPGVLRRLYVGRRTGLLTFLRGPERHSVRFRRGNIVSADTSVREDHMGELLVRQGRLAASDLKRALGFALRDKKRLGVVLMELGLLDEEGREEAVSAHVRHVLGKIFSWNEGTYAFREEPLQAEETGDITLRLSTGDLILQAARSVQDPDVIRYSLGDIDRRLGLSSDPLLRFQRINLSPVDGYVLSRIDGNLSAREVSLLIPLPVEQVHRSLFGLLSTGVVDFLGGPPRPRPAAASEDARGAPAPQPVEPPEAVVPAPPAEEVAEEEAEPEPEWIEETTRLPPIGRSDAEREPLPPSPPLEETRVQPPLSASMEETRVLPPISASIEETTILPPLPPLDATQILPSLSRSTAEDTHPLPPVDTRRLEILEAHAALTDASHFDVLGVPRDATEAQVREAYFRLAKRFHPDVHHDPALSDLREPLEQIFLRLGEAYEVLCHPHVRSRYERELDRKVGATGAHPAIQDPKRRAEQAEQAIRKGEDSVAGERYWEAIRLLESAIPRAEGETKRRGRVLLARAYSKTPGWVKQGEELLLAVLQEAPDHAEALLQLGRIYRTEGLRSRAITTLRRLIERHGDYGDARALLAELDPEGEVGEGPGLVKKLFGKKAE